MPTIGDQGRMKNRDHYCSISSLTLFALLFAGCAPIQRYEALRQPVGVRLVADIGSPLFRIERSSDLPNAFGNADVFGGKVSGGYTELVFAGMQPTGEIRFRLTDIATRSNETAMTRYGSKDTRAHATTTTYGNTSETDITFHEPQQGSTVELPPNTVEFLFDPRSGPLLLRGIEVSVLGVTPYNCTYALRDFRQPPPPRR